MCEQKVLKKYVKWVLMKCGFMLNRDLEEVLMILTSRYIAKLVKPFIESRTWIDETSS